MSDVIARGLAKKANNEINNINITLNGKANQADLDTVSSQLAQTTPQVHIENFKIQLPEIDDTARIQRALDFANSNGLEQVVLAAKTFTISETIRIPSKVSLKGMGINKTIIKAPKGCNFNALVLTDGLNQKISDFKIEETNRDFTVIPNGAALVVNGASDNVVVENVWTYGFNSGINVGAYNSSGTPTCTNITLRDTRTEYSRSFGIRFDYTIGVTLDNIKSFRNWLDGIKLEKYVMNVTVNGGFSSYNGESKQESSNANGNGIDCFAGGDTFVISNLVTEYNYGAGIYMKSGELNTKNTSTPYGFVRNAQVVNVRSRFNDNGSGINVNRIDGDANPYTLVAFVNIIGGLFEGNSESGINVRGRNVNITSPILKNNKQHGISVGTGWDVNITSPLCVGNGRKDDGGFYYGINLTGKRIKVLGGLINGFEYEYLPTSPDTQWVASTVYTVDSYVVAGNNVYRCSVAGTSGSTMPIHTSGTATDGSVTWEYIDKIYHYNNININPNCDEIIIKDVTYLNWTDASKIPVKVQSNSNQGRIVIDYGKPPITSLSAYGSEGSTLFYNGALYTKTTNITSTSGWKNLTNVLNEGGTVATFNGDGKTKTFSIAHGQTAQPNKVSVTPRSADAASLYYVSLNATNITVNFLTAPPTGTNNIQFIWRAAI